jgi:hypothetical protein
LNRLAPQDQANQKENTTDKTDEADADQ